MSKFAMLDFNSDSDEESTVNEINTEKEVQDSEESYLELTSDNLFKLDNVSNTSIKNRTSNEDSLLKTARTLIYDMMKGHGKITSFDKFRFLRRHNFTEYMSDKTKSFFTELYSGQDGGWQGEFGSIYTWRYGKNPDGSQIFLYISTGEHYGSCSGCDMIKGLEHCFYDLRNENHDAMEKIALFNDGTFLLDSSYSYLFHMKEKEQEKEKLKVIAELKESIKNNSYEMKKMIIEHILYVANNLVISRSYNEAVTHVSRYGSFQPPKFLAALKKAFPVKDFSHMEHSRIPGQRKHVLGNYLNTAKK